MVDVTYANGEKKTEYLHGLITFQGSTATLDESTNRLMSELSPGTMVAVRTNTRRVGTRSGNRNIFYVGDNGLYSAVDGRIILDVESRQHPISGLENRMVVHGGSGSAIQYSGDGIQLSYPLNKHVTWPGHETRNPGGSGLPRFTEPTTHSVGTTLSEIVIGEQNVAKFQPVLYSELILRDTSIPFVLPREYLNTVSTSLLCAATKGVLDFLGKKSLFPVPENRSVIRELNDEARALSDKNEYDAAQEVRNRARVISKERSNYLATIGVSGAQNMVRKAMAQQTTMDFVVAALKTHISDQRIFLDDGSTVIYETNTRYVWPPGTNRESHNTGSMIAAPKTRFILTPSEMDSCIVYVQPQNQSSNLPALLGLRDFNKSHPDNSKDPVNFSIEEFSARYPNLNFWSEKRRT